jgi:hypothetical protein
LPLAELLVIGDQSERNRKQANKVTASREPRHARGLGVLRAGRRIGLAQDQDTFDERSHVPLRVRLARVADPLFGQLHEQIVELWITGHREQALDGRAPVDVHLRNQVMNG